MAQEKFPLDGLRHHQLGPQRPSSACGYWLWNWPASTTRIIDPATGEASDWLELPPFLVTQEDIAGQDAQVSALEALTGVDSASWMPTAPWMP